MDNEIDNKKLITTLKKRVSYLRFTIYVFTAILALMTVLVVYWLYNPSDDTFETYYSTATESARASLYLSPKDGYYGVGDEFTVDVLINTAGNNVVATAAYLSFNKDAIQALVIDTSKSDFDMQAEKEINNEQGKIKITLGRPTPGIKTNAGLVATIHFKALKKTSPFVENLSFDFTQGSSLYSTIIIDDKIGTNILKATRGAEIFIN
jgi:hypothetical protein